jgi:hypothetical protein
MLSDFENGQRVESPVLHFEEVEPRGYGLRLLCKPDHPLEPEIEIVGPVTIDSMLDQKKDEAIIIIEAGLNRIAVVKVPYRTDLGPCSCCHGIGKKEQRMCLWCAGHGASVMDEAKEIAAAIYWSWIRSPGKGGGYVEQAD